MDDTQDLSIMFPPQHNAIVQGETVQLREYGWIEELELRPFSQPFISDLMKLYNDADVQLHAVEALAAKHIGAMQQMIAVSAGKSVQWVRDLSRSDGAAVYAAWWAANGPFLVSCATERVRSAMKEKALAGLML